jgi:hypothetical protein
MLRLCSGWRGPSRPPTKSRPPRGTRLDPALNYQTCHRCRLPCACHQAAAGSAGVQQRHHGAERSPAPACRQQQRLQPQQHCGSANSWRSAQQPCLRGQPPACLETMWGNLVQPLVAPCPNGRRCTQILRAGAGPTRWALVRSGAGQRPLAWCAGGAPYGLCACPSGSGAGGCLQGCACHLSIAAAAAAASCVHVPMWPMHGDCGYGVCLAWGLLPTGSLKLG